MIKTIRDLLNFKESSAISKKGGFSPSDASARNPASSPPKKPSDAKSSAQPPPKEYAGAMYNDSRIVVIGLNVEQIDSYIHRHSVEAQIRISTSHYPHELRGMRLTPQDRIIVLENVDLGKYYPVVREMISMITAGWVDIGERKRVI